MSYAATSNGCRSWRQFNSYRSQAVAWQSWQASDEGCFTYARDSTRASRHGSCAGRTKRFGQDRQPVLDCLVDWWSASSVRVARWSADGSALSQLPEDLRSGTLAWRRCDDALVHVTERSDCDSSSGETDRADGRSMHSMDVPARIHSKRQGKTWSCRDKGGQ